jgi:protein-disulfide isomerase
MNRPFRLQGLLDSATSVATFVAACAVVWTVTFPREAPRAAASPPARQPVSKIDGVETSLSVNRKGDEGAKLAIIEFSDFECPYCGRYSRDIYPQVQRELVDKGLVVYSFRHFPLESIHKAALSAAKAAACAGQQDKFWEMHHRMFQNQKQLDDASLVLHAKTAGIDAARFTSCVNGDIASFIKSDQEEARKFGINSTPTLLVGLVQTNGRVKVMRKLAGAQPYENIKAVLDEVAKES